MRLRCPRPLPSARKVTVRAIPRDLWHVRGVPHLTVQRDEAGRLEENLAPEEERHPEQRVPEDLEANVLAGVGFHQYTTARQRWRCSSRS